jgi:hypothetical protein
MNTAAKFAPDNGADIAEAQSPRALMPHYTVKEIAERWHLSDDAVRSIFEHEPGVLVLGGERKPGNKRKTYTTLRIPEDVVERVHRRLSRA